MKKFRLNYERFLFAYLLPQKTMVAILIIVLQTLQTQASNIEQVEVSLVREAVSVKDVLKELEKQSDYKFFYNTKVDVTRQISVQFNRLPLLSAVDQIFKGTKVSYRISGKQILLWRSDLGETIIQ